MKGVLIFIFIFGVISTAHAESKAKIAVFSDVSSKVAQGFCSKMDQCSPQAMTQTQCLNEMKGTLQDSYSKLPKEKKLEVPEDDLNLCLKSIKNASCEDLKTTQNLKGCEFIQQLPPG